MLERAREKRERLSLPSALPAERIRLIERNLDERVKVAEALVDACEYQVGSYVANFGGIDGIDAA